jgi:hypothetical protein
MPKQLVRSFGNFECCSGILDVYLCPAVVTQCPILAASTATQEEISDDEGIMCSLPRGTQPIHWIKLDLSDPESSHDLEISRSGQLVRSK